MKKTKEPDVSRKVNVKNSPYYLIGQLVGMVKASTGITIYEKEERVKQLERLNKKLQELKVYDF